jgi:hypothetical protein
VVAVSLKKKTVSEKLYGLGDPRVTRG